MKDLQIENYKTLIKETDDDSKNWKDDPMLLDWRIFVVIVLLSLKWPFYPEKSTDLT